MRFRDEFVAKDKRYSFGLDTETNREYISFPVSNSMAEYEEYYNLPAELLSDFLKHLGRLETFIEECRKRKHDELLVVVPGKERGGAS